MKSLTLKKNIAGKTDIENHLKLNDQAFYPNLSSYVNIPEYAQKLFKNAQRVELWDQELKGLLAYYELQEGNKIFITNFSIDSEYENQGWGTYLFNHLVNLISKDLEFKTVSILLEVYFQNSRAMSFYSKKGFQKIKEHDRLITMEKKINE